MTGKLIEVGKSVEWRRAHSWKMNWGVKWCQLHLWAHWDREGEPSTYTEVVMGELSFRCGKEGKEIVWEKPEDLPAGKFRREGSHKNRRGNRKQYGVKYVRRQMTREAYVVCSGRRWYSCDAWWDRVKSGFQMEFWCLVQVQSQWVSLMMPGEAPHVSRHCKLGTWMRVWKGSYCFWNWRIYQVNVTLYGPLGVQLAGCPWEHSKSCPSLDLQRWSLWMDGT